MAPVARRYEPGTEQEVQLLLGPRRLASLLTSCVCVCVCVSFRFDLNLWIWQFHMARTKAIFDWIFGVDNQQAYELQYLVSPDVGLTAEALLARLDREAASLESVQRLARSHRSLREVWRFLTSEHALYTAIKLVERAETSSKETGELVRESYGA